MVPKLRSNLPQREPQFLLLSWAVCSSCPRVHKIANEVIVSDSSILSGEGKWLECVAWGDAIMGWRGVPTNLVACVLFCIFFVLRVCLPENVIWFSREYIMSCTRR